jgi:shikimate kinase
MAVRSHIASMSRSVKSIVLIGMMGAGKSSVGRCLQKRTGLARFDTDEVVASKLGLSIPQIFSQHGEDRFREVETQVLVEFASAQSAIIVTGGGIVLREENVPLLKRLGTVIWLEADEETLFERATRREGRPLLKTENPRNTFLQLLRERTPLYARAADIRVNTSNSTHDEVADIILEDIEGQPRTANGDTCG